MKLASGADGPQAPGNGLADLSPRLRLPCGRGNGAFRVPPHPAESAASAAPAAERAAKTKDSAAPRGRALCLAVQFSGSISRPAGRRRCGGPLTLGPAQHLGEEVDEAAGVGILQRRREFARAPRAEPRGPKNRCAAGRTGAGARLRSLGAICRTSAENSAPARDDASTHNHTLPLAWRAQKHTLSLAPIERIGAPCSNARVCAQRRARRGGVRRGVAVRGGPGRQRRLSAALSRPAALPPCRPAASLVRVGSANGRAILGIHKPGPGSSESVPPRAGGPAGGAGARRSPPA